MSANGLYLIHRASCNSEGNATTLDETAQMLLKTDERIANIYAKRSGLPISHFIELMEYNQGMGAGYPRRDPESRTNRPNLYSTTDYQSCFVSLYAKHWQNYRSTSTQIQLT